MTYSNSHNNFYLALSKYNYKVKCGDILAGTVIGLERNMSLVNLGFEKTAFLPINHTSITCIKSPREIFQLKDIGEFIILFQDRKNEKLILSSKILHYSLLIERFKQIDLKNIILYTQYLQFKKTGIITDFDGLKLFLPYYHIPKFYRRKKDQLKFLPCKILSVNNNFTELIGSSRLAILASHSKFLKDGLFEKISVVSVKPFGLFVNLYGVKCLLHISELSNEKIHDIKQSYKKGDQIMIKVIYRNINQGKIAVSAKQI